MSRFKRACATEVVPTGFSLEAKPFMKYLGWPLMRIFPFLLILLTAPLTANAENFHFWYGSRGNTGKVISALCQAYNRSSADHQVICTNLGSYEATLQKTIAAYRAGKQPALVQIFDVAMLDMMMSDATHPIQEIFTSEQTIDWQDYHSAVTDFYGSSGGKFYSFPFNVSTIVLYSNRQQLERAGIERPPRTWEEFGDALTKLKSAGQACPWVFQLHPWYLLEQFSAVHNNPVATLRNGYDGLKAEYRIAGDTNRRFMEDIKRWHDQNLAILDSNLMLGNVVRAFGVGDCALMIESTAAFGAASKLSEGQFDIDISLLPQYSGNQRRNTLVGGASLWVMKGFDEKTYRSVSTFLAFLNTPENQLYLANRTGFLPVTNSAWVLLNKSHETDPLDDSAAYQLAATGLNSISNTENGMVPGLRLGFYVQFRQLWIKEMQRAFAGQQSIADALEKTEKSGNRLLRRFQRVYQEKPPRQ